MQNQKRNRPISRGPKWTVALVSLALLAATIALNILYHNRLYFQGVEFIINYQTYGSSSFVTVVHNLISILGQTYFVIALLVLTYLVVYRKMAVVAYICVVILSIYLVSIGKQAWQQPRPFWLGAPVKQFSWGCSAQYGHPSGHSTISVILYEPLITDFLGTGPFYIGLILPLLTGALIPLSRMYLGVHSSNQIIAGLLLSIFMLTMFRYILQRKMLQLYWRLMQVRKIALFIGILILHIIFTIVPIAIYLNNIHNRSFPQAYLDNITTICQKTVDYQSLEANSLQASAIVSVAFGFAYGFLILNSTENPKYNQYFVGNWKYGSCWNAIKKLFLYIVFAIIPGIVPIVLGLSVIHNAYGAYFAATAGYILLSMLIVSIVPILAFRFQVITIQGQLKPQSSENDKMAAMGIGNLNTNEGLTK